MPQKVTKMVLAHMGELHFSICIFLLGNKLGSGVWLVLTK